jgi:hypothetical protein
MVPEHHHGREMAASVDVVRDAMTEATHKGERATVRAFPEHRTARGRAHDMLEQDRRDAEWRRYLTFLMTR